MSPSDALPDPLRGNELGSFTHHSVAVRLPEIASRVISENELTDAQRQAMATLIDEIASGSIAPVDDSGPNAAAWTDYVAPHLGHSWLDAPWFFVEYYFYRRIHDALSYWRSGLDPFIYQKQLGLDQALAPARSTIHRIDVASVKGAAPELVLTQLIGAALWGNQVDLSLWPVAAGRPAATAPQSQQLLTDDRARAIEDLRGQAPGRVDIVLDNVGSELVSDLLLADFLLRSDLVAQVRVHAKAYPIFVSDATEPDVVATVDRLSRDESRNLAAAGRRLAEEAQHGRFVTVPSEYWTSPLGWRARPADVRAGLVRSALTIVKGDANYRRLVDDRHWTYTTPFADALGPTETSLLALRTLKSELVAGLAADVVAATERVDPEWMQNGRWAIASYAPKTP